jgi:hypothetical protein
MYDGHLSHTVTKDYLVPLMEKGLKRTFKTKEKGMSFLGGQELTPLTTNFQKREEMVSFR